MCYIKNINFSVNETILVKAQIKAEANNTTLDKLFQNWIRNYVYGDGETMKWEKDGKEESIRFKNFDLIIEKTESENYKIIIWDRQMTEDIYNIDSETNDKEKAKEKALKEYELVLNEEFVKYQESLSELNKLHRPHIPNTETKEVIEKSLRGEDLINVGDIEGLKKEWDD